MGHGPKFICPVTKLEKHLSAILYVNNMDILYIDLAKNKKVDEVHQRIQESIKSWGNLLIATGGALQPAKCFYSIIPFKWVNGGWRYASNENKAELGVSVPLPGGGRAGIGHKLVSHTEKTLGTITSPDGNSRTAITMMQDKVQRWVTNVQNGKLHCSNAWFLLKFQLCPQIVYSLCSWMATFDELSNALRKQYYQILPLDGIICTTTTESQIITSGFLGIGLPHLGVEALVAMSNKLLMHYGCDTATGRFMRAIHSLILLELGISSQPLQEPYAKYSFLWTHSWMKMLWEKISMFGVKMVIPDVETEFPQEGNRFFMQVFFEQGYFPESLLRLNRVRIYWQALFLSDILMASGKKINKEIIGQPQVCRKQLWLRWPTEHPTELDFQLWRDAVMTLCQSWNTRTRLGLLIAPTHRIWDWRWEEGSGCLCQSSKDRETEEVFRAEKKPNRFYYTMETGPTTGQGIICSVEPTHAG